MKLITTIRKVQTIPNPKNIEIINDFLEYMRKNGFSEHRQNNDLKVVISFATSLCKKSTYYDIKRKEQESQKKYEILYRLWRACNKVGHI